MKYKIVSDSSANLLQNTATFACVPMKIIGQQEYIDDGTQDTAVMTQELKHYKGKSSSSCPNVSDWLEAFEGGECIFAVTITQALSGSYNAAVQAGKTYMEEHPGAQVHVVDSMAAGPEQAMIVDKLFALLEAGLEPEAVMVPTPGSPPTRTSEPRTMPPPSTTSSSGMPEETRSYVSKRTCERGTGRVPTRTADGFLSVGAGAAASSASVLNLPQPGHFPSHLGETYPHSAHTNCVVALGILFRS